MDSRPRTVQYHTVSLPGDLVLFTSLYAMAQEEKEELGWSNVADVSGLEVFF